jgi:SAM-dependent methyltransferase
MFFKQLINSLPKLSKRYMNNNYLKIIITLIILYFIVQLIRKNTPKIEGFSQNDKFITKNKVDTIYDDFYSSIYDDLVYDPNKINFELQEIYRTTKMKPHKSIVLDIGSGNGHHINTLIKQNIETIGLEISQDMINRSRTLYPHINVKNGDALNSMLFNQNKFSHITCLYFTIYYIKDKRNFFNNCYKWLKPGGYLALHLVNRDLFNPIINAGDPLVMVSPQKYARDRITKSVVNFKDFKYKSKFNLEKENNIAYFEELFKDNNTNNVRKNIHEFYMPSQKEIITYAKESGFKLIGKIDLVNTKYEYQYIYILQK